MFPDLMRFATISMESTNWNIPHIIQEGSGEKNIDLVALDLLEKYDLFSRLKTEPVGKSND